MVTQSNFRLINDLFDNIALLDHNLKPIFQGSLLRKLLLENHINLSQLDLAVHKENILFNKFNEAVSFVEASGLPYTIKFPDIDEEFLLFSTSDGNYSFGKKENITHFIRIEHDLGERVKELECLYNISSEYDSMQQLDTFLDKCADLIEEGFDTPKKR